MPSCGRVVLTLRSNAITGNRFWACSEWQGGAGCKFNKNAERADGGWSRRSAGCDLEEPLEVTVVVNPAHKPGIDLILADVAETIHSGNANWRAGTPTSDTTYAYQQIRRIHAENGGGTANCCAYRRVDCSGYLCVRYQDSRDAPDNTLAIATHALFTSSAGIAAYWIPR